MKYSVEVEWKMRAYVEVDAKSSAAARRLAKEGEVPDDGEYVDDSLKATGCELTERAL